MLHFSVCSLPPEFCEFNPKKVFNKCKPWLMKNYPDLYPFLKGCLPPFVHEMSSNMT